MKYIALLIILGVQAIINIVADKLWLVLVNQHLISKTSGYWLTVITLVLAAYFAIKCITLIKERY